MTGGTQKAEGDADSSSFPFALVANSHRISKLVDSYDPARLAAAEHKAERRGGVRPGPVPSRLDPHGLSRSLPTLRVAEPGGAGTIHIQRNTGRRAGMSSMQRRPNAAPLATLPTVKAKAAPAAPPMDNLWLLSRKSVVAAVLQNEKSLPEALRRQASRRLAGQR